MSLDMVHYWRGDFSGEVVRNSMANFALLWLLVDYSAHIGRKS
jgi:hypothetical protein